MIPSLSRLASRLFVRLRWFAALCALTATSAMPAVAQPRTVGSPSAEPAQIMIAQPTQVRFSADIGDATLIPGGANLLRVGAPGTNPVIVGVLRDDGTNGDEIAGDGRYSLEVPLNEPAAKQLTYRISAAFAGQLRRVTSADIVVSVLANRIPVAVPGAAQAVRAGTTVVLDGRNSFDLDGDLLTFRWTLAAPIGSVAALDNSTFVRPSFTADVTGAYRAQLIVNDGRIDSVTKEVVVQAFVAGSTPPTALLGAKALPFGAAPMATVQLSGASSFDPEGASLTYAWKLIGQPASSTTAALSALTGATPVLSADKPGRYTVELTVKDAALASAPVRATITLYKPNTPPTIDAGADQNVTASSTVALTGAAADADADSLTGLRWSFIARPAGSTAVLTNATGLMPSFGADAAGDYLLELVVTDHRGASGRDRLLVRASGPADADRDGVPDPSDTCPNTPAGARVDAKGCAASQLPSVTISTLTANPASGIAPLTVNFVSQASGGSGPYTYHWMFGDATTATTQNASHTYLLPNTYSATVIATDSLGSAGQASATVTATAVVVNQAPVVNAGPAQTLALAATAALTGNASDDGLPNPPGVLTVNWSAFSVPAGAVVLFADAKVRNTTATFTTPGTYVLRLTADDGARQSTSDLQIVVNDSGPKIAALPDRTIPLGSQLRLRLAADDPNVADRLTFGLVAAPAGAALAPSPMLVWTPTAAQVGGPHLFAVTALDSFGHADTKSFRVTVTNANRAPVLGPLADDATVVGASYRKTLTTSDPDGGAPSLSLIGAPPGMTLTGSELAWTPTGSQLGAHVIKIVVTDAGLPPLLAAGVFTVTVESGSPPVARDDSYTVQVGTVLAIPAPGVLSNDVSGNAGALGASKLTDPDKGTLSAFGADGSFTYQAPAAFVQPALNPEPLWRGFPVSIGYSLVADFNRDGNADLFFPALGTLHALDGRTGAPLWEYDPSDTTNVNVSGCSIFTVRMAAVGDLTDTGDTSLVMSLNCDGTNVGLDDRFVAINASQVTAGKVRAQWVSRRLTVPHPGAHTNPGDPAPASPPIHPPLGASFYAAPTLARLDAAGGVKLLSRKLINSFEGSYNAAGGVGAFAACRSVTGLPADEGRGCRVTFVLNAANGAVDELLVAPNPSDENSGGAYRTNTPEQPPIVADLDGDGQVEIISGSEVWKRVNGAWTLAWQTPFEPSTVAVADLDGDGTHEVIQYQVGLGNARLASDSGIFIYRHDGILQRRIGVRVHEQFVGQLAVADVDGDKAPEILYSADGFLFAYRSDGRLLWIFAIPDIIEPTGGFIPDPLERVLRGGMTTPQVYDLDLDGRPEVIFTTTRRLFILDGRSGAEKWSIDTQGGHLDERTVILADMDNDGHVDIAQTVSERGNCGFFACPGPTIVVSGRDRNWAPGPKIFNQLAYRPDSVNDAGRILFDPSIRRDFRVPQQRGTIVDPRTLQGTSFTYAAIDNGVASAPATVYLAIRPANSPPVITSLPPTGILSVAPYTAVYQITATDPDPGDVIHYELVGTSYPFSFGVVVDPVTGAVSFYTFDPYNNVSVVVAAIDSQGARTEQSFIVNIGYDVAAVPNVVGQSLTAAIATAQAANLGARPVQEIHAAQQAGTVIGQAPLAGAANVAAGTSLDLIVSKGPQPQIVPNVVGKAEAAAIGALAGRGFSAVVTRQFNPIVASGEVLAQTPEAGSEMVPGPVTLVVSAGSGLTIRLSRSLTPANQAIAYAVVATDVNGNPVAAPAVTVAVTAIGSTLGSIPVVNGGVLIPAIDTRGEFRLTVAGGGASAAAEFVVYEPSTAAAPSQIDVFVRLDEVLEQMDRLLGEANAARLANDTATMTAKMTAWVNAWRTVDVDDLALSSPLSPEGGFPPTRDDMLAFGVAQTPDDVLAGAILRDAASDLLALEEALREPTTPVNQIATLFQSLNGKLKRLRDVEPGTFGVVDARAAYAVVLAHRLPRVMDALVDDVARALGLPVRAVRFPQLKRAAAVRVKSTLAEVTVTLALKTITDALGGGYTLRQFYRDATGQAVRAGVLLAAARHLKQLLNAEAPEAVISGASLSFRVFNAPYSAIEGLDLEAEYPDLNTVILIGPDIFEALKGVIDQIKATFGLAGAAQAGIDKVTSLSEAKKQIKDFKDKADAEFDKLTSAGTVLNNVIENAFQTPDPTNTTGQCIFNPGPRCIALNYSLGFKTVYQPSGSLSLPSPIIFIVRNNVNGKTLIDSPVFFPHN